MARRWNHNLHYHRLVLDSIPRGARTALDVGCGEGTLCRQLRLQVPTVVGIDVDPGSIAAATDAGGGVRYVLDDVRTHDFEPESFDVVTSVASLHHLEVADGLRRMRRLLRQGGVLVVVGVARRSRADLPYDAVGFVAHRLWKLRHGYWEHPSPVTEPTLTHRELRRLAADVLPGARYRQHVLFRYSVVWSKPEVRAPLGD